MHVANLFKGLKYYAANPYSVGKLDHYSSEPFNSPALGHEFVQSLGTAGGRGEAVPTVHQLHCL